MPRRLRQDCRLKERNVLAVNADLPALKLVEARDEAGDAALAGAGMAHKGHTFAGRDLQVEIPEQGFSSFRVAGM